MCTWWVDAPNRLSIASNMCPPCVQWVHCPVPMLAPIFVHWLSALLAAADPQSTWCPSPSCLWWRILDLMSSSAQHCLCHVLSVCLFLLLHMESSMSASWWTLALASLLCLKHALNTAPTGSIQSIIMALHLTTTTAALLCTVILWSMSTQYQISYLNGCWSRYQS